MPDTLHPDVTEMIDTLDLYETRDLLRAVLAGYAPPVNDEAKTAALVNAVIDIGRCRGDRLEREKQQARDADSRDNYRAHVSSLADDVEQRVKDGEEDVSDILHELCDQDYWVIYYAAARKAVEYSGNEDAAFEECKDLGGLEGIDSLDDLYPKLAYFCILTDVRDELESRGHDLNDPSSWFNEEEDDSEEEDIDEDEEPSEDTSYPVGDSDPD